MEFKGFYVLPAPPDAVWAALHDAGVLAAAIPGCETVTQQSDSEYMAKAVIRVGPVKARFEGKIRLSPETPPAGYAYAVRLRGEGQGGGIRRKGFEITFVGPLLAHELLQGIGRAHRRHGVDGELGKAGTVVLVKADAARDQGKRDGDAGAGTFHAIGQGGPAQKQQDQGGKQPAHRKSAKHFKGFLARRAKIANAPAGPFGDCGVFKLSGT